MILFALRVGDGKKVIWRHLDRVPQEKLLKRILWVTQDEKIFYSSAHYDIDIGFNLKFFGISALPQFCLVFLRDMFTQSLE